MSASEVYIAARDGEAGIMISSNAAACCYGKDQLGASVPYSGGPYHMDDAIVLLRGFVESLAQQLPLVSAALDTLAVPSGSEGSVVPVFGPRDSEKLTELHSMLLESQATERMYVSSSGLFFFVLSISNARCVHPLRVHDCAGVRWRYSKRRRK